MHDPRSQEEKARAALKRNSEMGHAPKQSPLTREPSVTPETFGDHPGRAPDEIERGMTSRDETPSEEAGNRPGDPNDPDQSGHGHADTRMGHRHVDGISDLERTLTGEPAQKK